MKNKFRIITAVLLTFIIVVSGGGYFLLEHFLPYSPIRPYRVKTTDLPIQLVLQTQSMTESLNGVQFETITDDTIALKCLFIKPNTDSKGTIILLHGIANRKESMVPQAIDLLSAGYAVILFDLRANGESGGINCTFGYYEKFDVSKVIDVATGRFGNLAPIGIIGHSLGAGIALQAMEIDKRIVCGVIESSFANLRETLYDYMERMFAVRSEFIADLSLKNTESIANFKIDSVRPEFSARNIDRPVLIIHGEKDVHIPIKYGKRIFENLHSTHKEFYSVPDGEHNNLHSAGGEEFEGKILTFFRNNLK